MAGDISSSTHPPLPPTTEDDRFSAVRLLRSRRVGISTYYRLLSEHGTAKRALDALPRMARDAGIADYQICPEGVVAAEFKAGQAAKARLIVRGEADYPEALGALADPPPMLWTVGKTDLLNRKIVAIVGARNASAAEGEGYVLTCVYDIPSNTSALCVFDAQNISAGPVGKAWVSHRVPVCFHGTWRPAA